MRLADRLKNCKWLKVILSGVNLLNELTFFIALGAYFYIDLIIEGNLERIAAFCVICWIDWGSVEVN